MTTSNNYTVEASKLGFSPVSIVAEVSTTSNSTDLELTAGNVSVDGIIDYVQMELWDDFSDDVVLTLIPSSGIEREHRTPDKVMANDGSWDGEWIADIEPGSWILYASVEEQGIVGMILVDADVHDGATVNLTMVQGGTLVLSTEWVDFDGLMHDLSETSVPGSEIIGNPEIKVSAGASISWNVTVDSNGVVNFLLPAGDIYLEGRFEATQRDMVMEYRSGMTSSISSQQESPASTLRYNRILDHSVGFSITSLEGANQTESSNDDVVVRYLNESAYEVIKFTIDLDYLGNEAFDEYVVGTVFDSIDAHVWAIEFYNGTDNGTEIWQEDVPATMGIDGGNSTTVTMRVNVSSVEEAQSLEAGHIIKLRATHTSGTHSEFAITVRITQTYSIEILSAPEDTIGVFPGEEERVEFSILNTGNGQDTLSFTIDKTWLPDGWSASGPSESPWASGEERTYSFTVVSPQGADSEEFTLVLNINSSDGTTYDPLEVTLKSAKPQLVFISEDTGTFSDLDAVTGERNKMIARVENTGLVDAKNIRVNITIEGYPDNYILSDIQDISAGLTAEYIMFIDLEGVDIGKQNFVFTLESEFGLDLDSGSEPSTTKNIHVETPAPDSVNIWVPLIIIAAFILGFIGFRRIRDSVSSQMPF